MTSLRKHLVELSLEKGLEVVGARCNDFAHHGNPGLVFDKCVGLLPQELDELFDPLESTFLLDPHS